MLGGGGEERDLGAGRDRHGADRPRRGRAARPGIGRTRAAPRDLAFILFTGEGERTRANRITNGRWALSAFGDRVVGGALRRRHGLRGDPDLPPVGPADEHRRRDRRRRAARARRATSSPTTFWDEVRRYGVTVVSYTWTMLREIAERPAEPGRAPPPGAAVHRLRDAARAVAAGRRGASPRPACSSSTPRPRARRSSSTSSGDKPGSQGPAAARQRRGPARRLRRADGRPARARRRLRRRVRAGRGRDAARPRCAAWSSTSESPLRGVFEPRRRLARDRRPVPRATTTATSGWSTTSPR